ncbi:hypothetical protein BV20DRAFT_780821 [Pilatotrama ljubarskyi]|nr:hypothetical protein BV20DRAFT_780821 [Pilatotrama ljubarskyi]
MGAATVARLRATSHDRCTTKSVYSWAMAMNIFAGPDQDVALQPLVDLWLDLEDHLKEEDIPCPLGFLLEREAIVKLSQLFCVASSRCSPECPAGSYRRRALAHMRLFTPRPNSRVTVSNGLRPGPPGSVSSISIHAVKSPDAAVGLIVVIIRIYFSFGLTVQTRPADLRSLKLLRKLRGMNVRSVAMRIAGCVGIPYIPVWP